jgi:hypothetical protein
VNARARTTIAVGLSVLLLGGAAAYCVSAILGYQSRQAASTGARSAALGTHAGGERIVFRSTTPDADYGLVASVPARAPGAGRLVSGTACDRVYSEAATTVCLRTDRGILTTFSANLLDDAGTTTEAWALPGIPSRARVSSDGSLVGFTSFVTGESYATIGFSTATRIVDSDGVDHGNLEDFALLLDGERNTAVDRNFWGVTFADDDNTFYATGATGGATWLVRGDLADRTLTGVRRGAECPSLSPDGSRIAYKKNVSTTGSVHWAVAVLDLTTMEETMMTDPRNIDDQVEWLDDETLLYAVPRTDGVGDSDVWSIAADGGGEPALLIEHASSPSVVRE